MELIRSLSGEFALDVALQAWSALRDNRLRTGLSIAGVTIGIMAVIAISTVSRGGRYIIFSELETFGLTSVWIARDYRDTDPHRSVRQGTGIVDEDYLAVDARSCPAIRRITPIVEQPHQRLLVRLGNHYAKATIQGVGADYFEINNDLFTAGRAFRSQDESRHVAVIGVDVARDLFGKYGDAVGQSIRIGQDKYVVIGVLGPKDRGFLSSIGSGGQNPNQRLLIPYKVLQQLTGNKDIDLLQGEAVSVASADAAENQLTALLRTRHSDRFLYRADAMKQYIETANRILRGVSMIGVVAASMSLIVGGTAIMNIMSVAVIERTREIGLRKAVGATRSDVLLQFLMEAVLISLLGGLLGLVLGIAVSSGLAILTGFPLTPSWTTVAIGLCVSIAVGLMSGYYPAYRAAALRPVDSLRYE
jgi:putative ABC transport system permease protein